MATKIGTKGPIKPVNAWARVFNAVMNSPKFIADKAAEARAREKERLNPALPPVAPPPTVDAFEGQGGLVDYRRRRRGRGRAGTILTGDLVPLDVGRKTLLG